MNVQKKQLSPAQVELTIEVSLEELQPFLIKSAEQISINLKIAGFRPGKAPYDMVKKQVGEMQIMEGAMENILSKTLYDALNQELKDVELVGQPHVDIEKMAPENPLVYKAVVTLLPQIKLNDYKTIEVKKKEVKVLEEEVSRVLKNLQGMHVKEALKDGAAASGDKVVVNFEVFVDGVMIEGGSAKEYPAVIGDSKFIPGFEEQLVGLNKGDKKEFELRFPKDYFQQSLAGKLAKFKVEAKDIYNRELPELNDEFAKTLGGYKDLAEIKAGIEKNIKEGEENKEYQRQEIEMLDKLIAATTFEDVPESLIHAEGHRMIEEMRVNIERQGLEFAEYLVHLKKSEEDLVKDFSVDAKKRVQTALIIREIAKEQKIEITPEEIAEEIKKSQELYRDDPEALKNLESPAYKRYLANILTNRKVIDFLRKEIIK